MDNHHRREVIHCFPLVFSRIVIVLSNFNAFYLFFTFFSINFAAIKPVGLYQNIIENVLITYIV